MNKQLDVVAHLVALCHSAGFHPIVDRTNDFLKSHHYTMLRFYMAGKELQCPVYDEFEDAHADNPALCLQLLLQELDDFEDATDFLVWAKWQGFDASDHRPREIWFHIRDIYPILRSTFGSKRVNDLDFQLNAGDAYVLRQLS